MTSSQLLATGLGAATAAFLVAAIGLGSCGHAPLPSSASAPRPPGLLTSSPVGLVEGRVETLVSGQRIPLPDVDLELKDSGSLAVLANAVSRVDGSFTFPRQPAGTYKISAQRAGLVDFTTPGAVTVTATDVYVGDLTMIPSGNVVFGRVTTLDGSPTDYDFPHFGVSERTAVTLVDFNDVPVLPSVVANDRGDYVLGDLPSGSHVVRAQLGDVLARADVAVSGTSMVDLLLQNSKPEVSTIVARSDGVGVRKVAPGESVFVTVDASDADADTLHYDWRVSPSNGTFQSLDDPTVAWNPSSIESFPSIYVLVTDGSAYEHRRLGLRVSNAGARFSGTVLDSGGGAIVGARVIVNGFATTSGANGFFRIEVPDAQRYTFSIFQFGFKLHSEVVSVPLSGRVFELNPAQMFTGLDPTGVIQVGGAGLPQVTIPAASLVDQNGVPAAGPVSLALSPIDPFDADGGFPGDNTGIDDSGTISRLITYGAVGVELEDGAGNPLNLAFGSLASLSVPIPNPGSGPPAVIPLWTYDEDEGLWRKEPLVATKVGPDYVFDTGHFSVINLDLELVDAACVRLSVQDGCVPIDVRVTICEGPDVGRQFDVALDDPINVISRLPPSVDIKIETLDDNGDPLPGTQITVDTGVSTPCALDLDLPYPYEGCGPLVAVNTGAPSDGGFLEKIANDEDAALAYYSQIDPNGDRTTFDDWKLANPYPEVGPAIYFNRGDLGVGRRMSAFVQPGAPGNRNVAYFVSNYSSVDDAISEDGLMATVAMEYSPHPNSGGARYTKFYVFDSLGDRVPYADLDGREPKFVPGLCLVCHKGAPFNPTLPDEGRLGAVFLPFDLESFRYSSNITWTKAAQQVVLKQLNLLVLQDTNKTPAIEEMIEGWYAPGLTSPTAIESWVPTGWSSSPDLYNKTIKPYCRTCHTARTSTLDFNEFTDANTYASTIKSDVCDKPRVMPHALQTYLNFWCDPPALAALENDLPNWPAGPCPCD